MRSQVALLALVVSGCSSSASEPSHSELDILCDRMVACTSQTTAPMSRADCEAQASGAVLPPGCGVVMEAAPCSDVLATTTPAYMTNACTTPCIATSCSSNQSTLTVCKNGRGYAYDCKTVCTSQGLEWRGTCSKYHGTETAAAPKCWCF
jgi:hypothetical protein